MIKKTWLSMMAAFFCLFDEQARQVVECLKEENRVLREQLHDKYGCRQVRLTDSQRRRLAGKGMVIGRRLLDDVTDLFSPDTILKWYRQLIAKKYDGSPNRKGGRPKVRQETIDTVLRLAKENPHWGFGRIRNWMVYLGYAVVTIRGLLVLMLFKQHHHSRRPRFAQMALSYEIISTYGLASCHS